jgi:Uma2 family endonuclease
VAEEEGECGSSRLAAMTSPPKKPATSADLQALPPNVVGQIINGALIVTPRPSAGHSLAASTLTMDLGSPFQRGRGGPGGWWFYFEPELHFDADIVVPDIAAWRSARMPSPPAPKTPFFTLAPDWVCEVLSPGTASVDRVAKSRIYARAGVSWLWFIDPVARTLEASRLDAGQWVQLGAWADLETRRVAPFEAIGLQLEALWSPAGPEAP